MEKAITSLALEANLSRTLNKVEPIPPEQQWLAELSSSTWGIHNRAKEFLTELNHKFRNDKHVIDLLHSICLEDFWFYHSLPESERALSVLIDIFEELLASVKKDADREFLATTFIQFMDRLSTRSGFSKSIISRCFSIIEADIPQHEEIYIRISGYFKACFDRLAQYSEFLPPIMRLTSYILERCYDYWEETSKPETWFQSRRHLFTVMDAEQLQQIGHPFFVHLHDELKRAATWEELKQMLFFKDISNHFRSFTKEIVSSLETIHYLYYLLHLPGMFSLYDHLLYDMNRNLRSVFKELEPESIPAFLDAIFEELEELKAEHGRTVLDCIATLGKEVLDAKHKTGVSHFIKRMLLFGFNHPGQIGINSDWQVMVNPNHVKNIRVFFEIVEKDPFAMRELINTLIVELKLGGIYISDTDLFQRDVTKLLNSGVAPVYREIKQLTRIFPVFFQDIGAEGKLRKVTTAIDGLSMRKDRLIHFLRVQIHVESNNTNVLLTRRIIQYWYDGDKQPLRELLPEELYHTLEEDSAWHENAHAALKSLCKKHSLSFEDLLKLNIESLEKMERPDDDGINVHWNKVIDILEIYNLLLEKYSFETEDVIALVEKTRFFSKSDLEQLASDMQSDRNGQAITLLYKMMNHLKSVILSPEKTEAFENIQFKRHIAAGIPSTYGQYKEPKFEALGLTYRLERVVSKLMAGVLGAISHEYITAKTLRQIYDVLLLFREGLALDGIYDQSLNSHLEMFKYSLTSPSFSLSQYINIFQFIGQDVGQIIKGYFLNIYERPLAAIVPQVLAEQSVPPEQCAKERIQMEKENFFRDILSSTFLVQELDLFIANIISTLRSMVDSFSNSFIENMLTYDPDLTFSLLSQDTSELDNPIFLGAKAFFLKKLSAYGFPVPPGFVITTEAFRHIEPIYFNRHMHRDFVKSIEHSIAAVERQTGKNFGDPANPLFFSVRSGSFISFPGAMKTFLNVGMNDTITKTWAASEPFGWTAWDCYRRFLQSWGMAFGVDRDTFDKIMLEHKKRIGVELKIQFTKEQMRRIASDYKKAVLDHGVHIESEPIEQLKVAIRCVLDSWTSESSKSFRDYMQVANEWGTAVLVQKMVLGNLSRNSGTGVVFTSSPLKDYSSINLYGDFAVCSQGEDVVSGLVNTLPISETQRKKQYNGDVSLESTFPKVYGTLYQYARQLIEQHGFVHQEIEFTFEDDDPARLYILQTRNQKVSSQKSTRYFAAPAHEMKLIGHGIGVSGGVLSGLAAFDMEDMDRIKGENPDAKLILIRPDTVPDDIPMLFVCDGLVTAKGGSTSHAAVTAVGLGKVCIVKCNGLQVSESEKMCTLNGCTIRAGDAISIDGEHGSIYEGSYEIIEK
ncbi:MAG TPA: PEP/pyruvate-binding domain-containing protein [Clostridia bacterium]|nr:PEP/pyruvate-binding domain-containing protein [Clostridia bacterium]